jgi:DNA replication protein DnaC
MTAFAESVDQKCAECGGAFSLDLVKTDGWLADKLQTLATMCDDCVDRADAADVERDRTGLAELRLKSAGLPREFAAADLASLHPGYNGAAHGAALRWANGEIRGLLLHGEIGVGKSTLAAAALRARLVHQGVQWASVPSLIAKAFGDQQAKEHVAHVLTGVRSLVLDDLDKVKPGDWVASQLFAAIDNRVTAGTGLIVTTNLDNEELAERFGDQFGDAIASRLAGYCEIHGMRGPDRRLG